MRQNIGSLKSAITIYIIAQVLLTVLVTNSQAGVIKKRETVALSTEEVLTKNDIKNVTISTTKLLPQVTELKASGNLVWNMLVENVTESGDSPMVVNSTIMSTIAQKYLDKDNIDTTVDTLTMTTNAHKEVVEPLVMNSDMETTTLKSNTIDINNFNDIADGTLKKVELEKNLSESKVKIITTTPESVTVTTLSNIVNDILDVTPKEIQTLFTSQDNNTTTKVEVTTVSNNFNEISVVTLKEMQFTNNKSLVRSPDTNTTTKEDVTTLSNNVNDGLDDADLIKNEMLLKKEDTLQLSSTVETLTTEQILDDIEKTAFDKQQHTKGRNTEYMLVVGSDSKSEHGRNMPHTDEVIETNIEATTLPSEPIVLKLAKGGNVVDVFTNSTDKKTVLNFSETLATTTAHPDFKVATLKSITPTPPLQAHIASATNEAVDMRTPSSNATLGSEKRAKFINDNSTNAQQLNLPDAAEVWTLVGMKTVPPKTNISMEETLMQQSNELLPSTEKSMINNTTVVNSNSEKNLLDWTQIMRHGDLETQKLSNISKNSTESNNTITDTTLIPVTSEEFRKENVTKVKLEVTTSPTEETNTANGLNEIPRVITTMPIESLNNKSDLLLSSSTTPTTTTANTEPEPIMTFTSALDMPIITTEAILSKDKHDNSITLPTNTSTTPPQKDTHSESDDTLNKRPNELLHEESKENTRGDDDTNTEPNVVVVTEIERIELDTTKNPYLDSNVIVTLNVNNNNNNNNNDTENTTLARTNIESTTLSTLEASRADTTASERHNENSVEQDFNEFVAEKTTTTTATILVTNSQPNNKTEVGQYGNQVELVEKILKPEHTTTTASTTKSQLNTDNEIATSSSADELLLYTTTTAKTTTTATEATLTLDTTGSVEVAVAENRTTEKVTAVENTNSFKPSETAVQNVVTHESESSLETNVVDPLDKSEKSTTPETTDIKPKAVIPPKDSQTNAIAEEEHNEELMLPDATTTMDTFVLSTTIKITTTTQPPLFSLLDDTTTTTTTTTTIPPTTKPSSTNWTTESVAFNTTTADTTLLLTPTTTPISTTTAESTTSATTIVPPKFVEASSTPASTTMLPPQNINIAAAIGGGAASPMPTMPTGNLQPNSADASGTDVNVIIAISVSVIGVVALILLVAFLYLMRKRQKQMSYGQRCRPVNLDAYSLDNVSVLGSVRRKGALRASKRSYGNVAFDDPSLRHNVLSAIELSKFVDRRSSIFEEFRDVPQIIARADEVPQGCEDKNRYANVIPLPETRVILQQQNDDEKTEYINANYVRGPKDTPNYYIACQAPLEPTVADFWRMIWEQQSRVIIQASDLIENGIEKCAEYLPPSVTLDNHTTYGDFQVTLKNREVKDKYAISTIMLRNMTAEDNRELTHYWYKWPEAGVPSDEAPIIAMLLEARSSLKSYAIEQLNDLKEKSSTLTLKSLNGADEERVSTSFDSSQEKKEASNVSASNNEINGNVSTEKLKAAVRSQGPLTIHCSPGTGRTGCIIACDMAIRSLETPKRTVDIPQIVYYVRRGRASAVQTKEQYEFIYKVANMYATKITNITNDN